MPIYLEQGIQDSQLIYDTNPGEITVLGKMIAFARQQVGPNRPISLLLPGIHPGPGEEDSFCHMLTTWISIYKVDTCIVMSPSWHPTTALTQLTRCYVYPDLATFINDLPLMPIQGHAVVVKNNPAYPLEPLCQLLRANNHVTTLTVDLDAIANNLRYFREKLAPTTRIIAMLKAHAYGTSVYQIGQFLQTCPGIAYLAVCYVQEGINLRKNGVHIPLMVMNPAPIYFDQLATYQLEPLLYSLSLVDDWISYAKEKELNLGCHLKLDTGMHRLGLLPSDLPTFFSLLQRCPSLPIKSICSHWAAPIPDHAAYTHEQAALFQTMATSIEQALGRPVLKHLSNTVGIEHFARYQFDMVRIGMGLYGIDAGLTPAITLKTTVAQIKTIPAGATIGYDRKGVASRLTRLAILNIGYADGFKRIGSQGRGHVWINGQIAVVVGQVCMDMIMVDVTGLTVAEGDTAVIFGPEWPFQNFVAAHDTIAHEALTNIGPRVRRIYCTSL